MASATTDLKNSNSQMSVVDHQHRMAALTLSLTTTKLEKREKKPLFDCSASSRDLKNYAKNILLFKFKNAAEFNKETQLNYANVLKEKQSKDWTQKADIKKAEEFQKMKIETDRISKNCQHKYNNSQQKPKYDHWSLIREICGVDINGKEEDGKLVEVYIDHKGKKIYDLSMGVVQARYHHNKWRENVEKFKNYFSAPTQKPDLKSNKPNGLPYYEAEDLITIKNYFNIQASITPSKNDKKSGEWVLKEEQKRNELIEWIPDQFIDFMTIKLGDRQSPMASERGSPEGISNRRPGKMIDNSAGPCHILSPNDRRRYDEISVTPIKNQSNTSVALSKSNSGSGSDRSRNSNNEKENNAPIDKPKVKGLLDTPEKAMLYTTSRLEYEVPKPREERTFRSSWRNPGTNNQRRSVPPVEKPEPRPSVIQNVKKSMPPPLIENKPVRNTANPEYHRSENNSRYNNTRGNDHHRAPLQQTRGNNNNRSGQNNYSSSSYHNQTNKFTGNNKIGHGNNNNFQNRNQNNVTHQTVQKDVRTGYTPSLGPLKEPRHSQSNESLKENAPMFGFQNDKKPKLKPDALPFRPKNQGKAQTQISSYNIEAAAFVPGKVVAPIES